MKKPLWIVALALSISSTYYAQEQRFYATMDLENAKVLQTQFPDQVIIFNSANQQAAVEITENAGHYLHKNVLGHGPGYVYQNSLEDALQSISISRKPLSQLLSFTISENDLVNAAISKVDATSIKNHIQVLENYGTRKHNTTTGMQAPVDLKAKWEQMIAAAGRSDITVRLVTHTGTPMKSVILTIPGQATPNEYIVVGGHLDSISYTTAAPGADDDASGIATITEMLRVLLDVNFKPKRTVELMAYAAEEIGLVGSSEIAAEYKANNKNVLSMVQFDMTNYNGSSQDIYLTTDDYVNSDLNLFLIELISHYNTSGSHTISYGNTSCNYGCSDHYSWAQKGYPSAFPFEAKMSEDNPYIHSPNDTLANMGNNALHAAKFAKLGLEFIIETSKSASLATQDFGKTESKIYLQEKNLMFDLQNLRATQVQIIDGAGRTLRSEKPLKSQGSINLNALDPGFYIAVFKIDNGQIITKKFILK